MTQKAMENEGRGAGKPLQRGVVKLGQRRTLAAIVLLAVLALSGAFCSGLAIGGYLESVKLRHSLELIPDINPCYP
jgi:hypothetical protein